MVRKRPEQKTDSDIRTNAESLRLFRLGSLTFKPRRQRIKNREQECLNILDLILHDAGFLHVQPRLLRRDD